MFWVDIKLAQKNGLKFYQTRSNAIILHNTLPAYCIPKVVRMETGEFICEKVYESPRMPPKISLRQDWMLELGSEVAWQAEVHQPIQTTWQNGETRCDWTTNRFVHTVRRGGDWLQSIWIATCCCENKPKVLVFRELVKQIENHPHRQALQDDLQQNNAYNPFSEKLKKMIKDMGNVELFEVCETMLEVQCKECLLDWN